MSQAVRKRICDVYGPVDACGLRRSVSVRCLLGAVVLFLFLLGTATCFALPDMQSISKPNPEPSAQTGWDTFSPPASGSPAASTPIIAEWTRTGVSDDTLALTGDLLSSYTSTDEGKDSQFLLYGQTTSGDGVQAPALVQRIDGRKAAVTLPTGLPAWSTYLMWPRNSYGYGYPVAVNRTDAWWVGPNDKVTRGDTVSVYGRNLAHDNGTSTSWVYVKPAGSAGYWATVTSVNPYRVQFTVPASCTNGTYEVWVHNGHGGSYGWSGPLTLVVTDSTPWNGPTFDVTDYGATGDGVTDDTAAFDAVWTAVWNYRWNNPGSRPTVYIPAGTYMTHHCINPAGDIRWMGAGMNSTILKGNAALAYGLVGTFGASNNWEIRDLTLDGNGYVSSYLAFLNFGVGSTDIRCTNVRFQDLANTSLVYLTNTTRTFFTGCEFIGGQMYMVSNRQVHYKDCDYWGANDTTGFIYAWDGGDFSLTGCTAQDYNINNASGCSRGRFLCGAAHYGTFRNVYIGECVTTDQGPHTGSYDQNSGEQIMCEGICTPYEGSPTSATSTTVTFGDAGALDVVDDVAVIINGKGMGQYRTITAYNSGTKTITVSPAWNVVPDTGSRVLLERIGARWAIYNNQLDGKNDYATRHCAIYGFASGHEWIAASNTVTNMGTCGVILGAAQQADPLSIMPNYWNYYASNVFQNNYQGIAIYSEALGTSEVGPGLVGNMFRDNQFTNVTSLGVYEYNAIQTAPGNRMDMNVFDNNTFTNLPKGIDFDFLSMGARTKSNVLYKNSFSLGTAQYSGSFALEFGSNTSLPDLRQNTYTGFATTYAGSAPGAILEIPTRKLDTSGIAGGSSKTVDMIIWNAGTSSLSWTASDDQTWLTLSSGSGSVANENSSSTITLTCNPSGLSAGTYTGTVTVTGASQTKKVIVTFTVAANTPPTVSITAPTGGFSSAAPATINITASASDTDGTITQVEFYNNGILLGTDTSSAGGWTYSWANVEASGSSGIVLTAKAYDDCSGSTTSSSVTGTVTDSALKCYWKLDSSSGTSCTDSSGTGNTGTTYNSPTWTAGKVLNCLSFNGSNQYAQKTTATGLPVASADQTLCFWMYVSANPTARKTAMCVSNGTTYGTFIGFASSTTFGVWRSSYTNIVTTTSRPTAGYWHHIAYVKSGSNKYLYIDGAQAATSTSATDTQTPDRINVGRSASGSFYWPGKVDEARVYNRVLTLAEIQSLAAGKQ